MKTSKAIEILQSILEKYGDLPIVGGFMCDDTPPTEMSVIGDDGCCVDDTGEEPTGVYIQ